jgi:FdhD protein
MTGAATPRRIIKVGPAGTEARDDLLVAEAPVEIRLDGTPLAVLMRTPGDDEDLALGFALTEGIVDGPEQIAAIERRPGHEDDSRWDITLADGITVDPEQFRRNTYTTSSCGVCGKASIDAVRVSSPPPPEGPVVAGSVLAELPRKLEAAQEGFAVTGGLHAAAAFTPAGELGVIREDIGRHNAVDKLVGVLARGGWPLDPMLLMVSGRVSFEIVQKAAVARISIVCGVSAASSLAVDLAEELGLTLVGFLRGETYNVYADPGRLQRA